MLNDLRLTLRSLRRSPGFALAVIGTLALGIGATVAIFSVVDAVVFRSLGLRDAEHLVEVEAVDTRSGGVSQQLSFPDFRDLRASNQSFASMAAFRYWLFTVGGGDHPEGVIGIWTGDSLFRVLGVRPALGRLLPAGAEQQGAPLQAVISYRLWQRRFGGSTGVVGSTADIDGRPVTIIGVLPRDFAFPDVLGSQIPLPARDPDLFMPVGDEPWYDLDGRGSNNYWVFARETPGVTAERVTADLGRMAGTLAHDYPDQNTGRGLAAVPLKQQVVGDAATPMKVLFGAVVLVLLIACANVGGLQVVRSAGRARELGIRTALGASRGRLIRQSLVESLVLAGVGGSAGLLLAVWTTRLLALAAPNSIARIGDVGVNARVVLFAIGVTIVTGLVFGLAPIVQQRESGLAARLRQDARAVSGPVSRRLRTALVAGEVALALVLLTGAGLLVRSFARLASIPVGFDAPDVMTMFTILPPNRYGTDTALRRYHAAVLAALDAVPGVQSAAAINTLPLSNLGNSTDIQVVGHAPPGPGEQFEVDYRSIAGPYFRVMGIPLVAGRDFGPGDTAGVAQVVLINQAAARRYFPGENPLGHQLRLMDGDDSARTIVGIVADVHGVALDSAAHPEVSFPVAQDPQAIVSLAVQTSGDPYRLLPAMQHALAGVDPEQAYYADRTMDDLLAASLAARRFDLELLAGFAVLAIVLAGVGLYSVIAFSVAQRVREIGVRSALGADQRRIAAMVIGEGLRVGAIGVAVGLMGAFLTTRLLHGMLYRVGTIDPVTYAVTLLAVLAVVLFACWLPARRAAAIDPMEALKD